MGIPSILHPLSFPVLRPSYGAALPASQGQNFCLNSCFIQVPDPQTWNKEIIPHWLLVQWVQYRGACWHSSRPSSMQRTHGHSRFSAQTETDLCFFLLSRWDLLSTLLPVEPLYHQLFHICCFPKSFGKLSQRSVFLLLSNLETVFKGGKNYLWQIKCENSSNFALFSPWKVLGVYLLS